MPTRSLRTSLHQALLHPEPRPGVIMREPGRLIGEGRDSLVDGVGVGRVLRRYRRPQDTTVEAQTMTWVGEHGVRVPRVYDAAGTGLGMERIDGRAALAGLATQPWLVPGVGFEPTWCRHREGLRLAIGVRRVRSSPAGGL